MFYKLLLTSSFIFSLSACVEETADTTTETITAPANVKYTIKQDSVLFEWDANTSDLNHFRIMYSPDTGTGYGVVEGARELAKTSTSYKVHISGHLIRWGAHTYVVEACNERVTVCESSGTITLNQADSEKNSHFFKASQRADSARYGHSVAISKDGKTVAIASPGYSNGRVFVYTVDANDQWIQVAKISAANEADNPNYDGNFGNSISLSADGKTLAVGAPFHNSVSGTNLSQQAVVDSGAVYIYTSDAQSNWTQQAYIPPSASLSLDTVTEAHFGSAVDLSDDGNTLAIGMPNYLNSDRVSRTGAAFIFKRTNNTWAQLSSAILPPYTTAFPVGVATTFGASVSLSGDAAYLAVGDPQDDYVSTSITKSADITPVLSDRSGDNSGAVFVYQYDATKGWAASPYVHFKASNANNKDSFGTSVDLNQDGSIMVVGAPNEDSNLTGSTTDSSDVGLEDNSITDSGAAYVFVRENIVTSNWQQKTFLKASNPNAYDKFGYSVSIDNNGQTIVIGANEEGSAAIGINGDQSDNSKSGSGAAYTFVNYSATTLEWSQETYLKGQSSDALDLFGSDLMLSGDGKKLIIGATNEASYSTTIDGAIDNSGPKAGAAYLY